MNSEFSFKYFILTQFIKNNNICVLQNIFFNAIILYYFLIKQYNVYADLFTNKTKL